MRGNGREALSTAHRFAALSNEKCLRHVYSGRQGGVSPAPFSSLNMSVSVGDEPERVYENRRRLIEALDDTGHCLAIGGQVHGAEVWEVTATEAAAAGWRWDGHRRTADAMITRASGVVLLSLFADCPIVLLFDSQTPALGLVHSGWRGTASRIVSRAVEEMSTRLGSRPESLRAAITPHIQRCCFEVGPEVPEALSVTVTAPIEQWTDSARSTVDLSQVLRSQLLDAGVLPEHCEVDSTCTRCDREQYFSHRGDGGRSGRNGIVALLRD